MTDKIGVIIANTGTPASPSPKDVKKYLSQFLMDKRICPMPRPVWWILLHTSILRKRSKDSAKKYEAIWTADGSPLIVASEALARGLNEYYREINLPVCVRCAMSYGTPTLKSAVKQLKKEGCTRLVVLPMYPQSAHSTTFSVIDRTHKALRSAHWKYPVDIIESYGENAVYVRAIAASVTHAGFDAARGDRLLFSYHSIPLKDIEAGDTYELQTGATSLAVAGELGLDRRSWTISYQSRFDTSRTWLSPFTRPALARMARAAHDGSRLFMICPNFAVDCLETLYDIPFELEPLYYDALSGKTVGDDDPDVVENVGKRRNFPQAAREAPDMHATATDGRFVYVPCLNKSRAHLTVLTSVLAPYVGDDTVC